ncbi:ATP-dependent RNA helicase p62-like [Elysia marginata]|uniref:ATP-dependent RNA helicase p62-like n=1 Tax=Elysia marginata TaxID=1093978 RepID=A0AAV4HLI2_9GAST|nr:ATP-dependent RNA helicase p62-like [Elysia marginata]
MAHEQAFHHIPVLLVLTGAFKVQYLPYKRYCTLIVRGRGFLDLNFLARLKSRKSFRTVESVQPDQAASHRLELWNTWDNTTNEAIQPPKEQLPSGIELQRKDWVTLNRARAKVGKTASTLHKWKLRPNSGCPCGNQNQTMDHILSECTEGPHCTDQDLRDCTDAAQAWITHWRDKIW